MGLEMNRKERREKHVFTGAQLEKLIQHNIREGFENGKVVTIGKMTEIYSVAVAYALLKETNDDMDSKTTKDLINTVIDMFSKFLHGEVDYDEAKKFVEENGIVFEIMPSTSAASTPAEEAQEQP